MTRGTRLTLLVLTIGTLAVSAMTSACSPSRAPDDAEAAVRGIVERYDELLARGYRTLDMDPLQAVATTAQVRKEYTHMASLGESGIALRPDLLSIDFTEVTVEGRTARALTSESWSYTQVSIDTSETLAWDSTLYSMRYDLSLDRGGWKVTGVTAIDSRPGPRLPGATLPTSAVPFTRPATTGP